jgi:hypothetical protein
MGCNAFNTPKPEQWLAVLQQAGVAAACLGMRVQMASRAVSRCSRPPAEAVWRRLQAQFGVQRFAQLPG